MAEYFSDQGMKYERAKRQATATRPATSSIPRPASSAALPATRAAGATVPGSVGAAFTGVETAPVPQGPPTGVVLTTRANSLYSESFAGVAATSYVPTQTAIPNPNANTANSNPTTGSATDSGAKPMLTRPALYGIIGGGAGLVAILAGLVVWWCWRKKRAAKEERSWWKLNESGADRKDGDQAGMGRDPGYLTGEGANSFSREKGDDGRNVAFGAGVKAERPSAQSKHSDRSVRSQSQYYQHQAPAPTPASLPAQNRAELFALAPPIRRTDSDVSSVNGVITFGGDGTKSQYPPPPPRQGAGPAAVTHAYSMGPSSSNRPFSKALPPSSPAARPNYRPNQIPQNAPPNQRLPPAPLGGGAGGHRDRSGAPLPSSRSNESLNSDSRSRGYGAAIVDPLGRGDERRRGESERRERQERPERQEMERLRSGPSPDSNRDISGAQSAWADLQPQTTNPSMLSATNAPVRTGSGSKRVRPPLPSPMTLVSSNDAGTSTRSRQNASPEASFVRTEPVDRNPSQSSSRAPVQYARVDSRPLQDLEDILDSFAYNTRGEKHPSSANSSSRSPSNASRASETSSGAPLQVRTSPSRSAGPTATPSDAFLAPNHRSPPRQDLHVPQPGRQPAPSNAPRSNFDPAPRRSPIKTSNSAVSNTSPTKQQSSRAPVANHGVTPSQGSSLDFGNSDAETQVVRKVSLRRSPSNPIRLETLRDQQHSNHNNGNQRRPNNSPPRSSNSSPSFDHSLDSVASSASPVTPRDHHLTAFARDQQYQQQQNYPPSHLYAPKTQAPIGLVPDYDQRYSKSPRRSAIESIYGSYDYDDDDRAVA